MTTIYTKSQVRAAILKAADHIERNPTQYNFGCGSVPKNSCGTTACMWGWIGFFLGMYGEPNGYVSTACGVNTENSCGTGHLYDFCKEVHDPAIVPRELRAYADRYFPAEPQRAEGPLVHTDLVPLAEYHEFLRAVRAGELVSDVESGVGA